MVEDLVSSELTEGPVGHGLPEEGRVYPVLMGDYASEKATWARTDIAVGAALVKPTPLFTKLAPELGETGPDWAPINK